MGSLAMLIPDDTRLVQVRASFPLDGTDPLLVEAWQLAEALLQASAPDE